MDKYNVIDSIYQEKVNEISLKNYIKEYGSPIIDDRSNEKNLNVIYVFVAQTTEPKRICLVSAFDNGKSPKNNVLKQILNTNIYYHIEKIPNDVYNYYSFCIDNDYTEDELWEKAFPDEMCKNFIYFKEDGEDSKRSYFKMPNAKDRLIDKVVNEKNKGNLEYKTIYSNAMKKTYNYYLYLPYNYNPEKEYKLLVLNDGTDYLYTLKLKEILDYAISNSLIPEVIVCFIINQDRGNELCCNKDFSNFIARELINDLDIKNKPENNIIGGLSLGGLMAMYVAQTHPEVFKNVISESGSFWWSLEDNEFRYDVVNKNGILENFKKLPKLDLNIYMTTGKTEFKNTIIGTNKEIYEYLLNNGYNVKYSEFASAHDYLFWADEIINGLKFLCEN